MKSVTFSSRPRGPKCCKYQNVPMWELFWPIGKPRERFQSWVIKVYFISVPMDHTVSSSARVTSVKSQQGVVRELERLGPIDRTPGIPGFDKNWYVPGHAVASKPHLCFADIWVSVQELLHFPVIKINEHGNYGSRQIDPWRTVGPIDSRAIFKLIFRTSLPQPCWKFEW